MKTLVFALILLFAVMTWIAHAQEVIHTNQTTIEWDPVTTLADGTAIPAEDTIEYEVLIRNVKVGEISMGTTAETQYVITFDIEGYYAVGVKTLRYVAAESDALIESEINWSDINGESTPIPFVIAYIRTPSAPLNLGVVQ